MTSAVRDSTEWMIRRLLWNNFKHSFVSVQKRFRYKPKWSVHEKPMTNCDQALRNFDAFNKPFYGKDWPSIRISLLSLPKYCASVNKYGDVLTNEDRLNDLGAANFLHSSRLSQHAESEPKPSEKWGNERAESRTSLGSLPSQENFDDNSIITDGGFEIDPDANDDLNVFVPTEKIYSERDLLLREEFNLNAFESRQISAQVLPAEPLAVPSDLNAFVNPHGDVSTFPSPKPYRGLLGYYLMDAASVLPVIALNVQPDDQVLDLCAAPGGKTFLVLQSLDLHGGGTLHCNDSAQARLARLRSVLKLYFPTDVVGQVSVTKLNGTASFPPVYNKVLVDAPCNSDRHVATEDDNNLFKVSRTRERLGLTQLQKELLISGIKSCVPGGTIVYSTCTLSPAQNDGVIQAAVEELYETTEVEIAVQDLSTLRHALSDTFKFHDNTKHGLTVLPNLLNNFGPSYVAKLRRIK